MINRTAQTLTTQTSASTAVGILLISKDDFSISVGNSNNNGVDASQNNLKDYTMIDADSDASMSIDLRVMTKAGRESIVNDLVSVGSGKVFTDNYDVMKVNYKTVKDVVNGKTLNDVYNRSSIRFDALSTKMNGDTSLDGILDKSKDSTRKFDSEQYSDKYIGTTEGFYDPKTGIIGLDVNNSNGSLTSGKIANRAGHEVTHQKYGHDEDFANEMGDWHEELYNDYNGNYGIQDHNLVNETNSKPVLDYDYGSGIKKGEVDPLRTDQLMKNTRSTDPYGSRDEHPVDKKPASHWGVDIVADNPDKTVYAAADGKVVEVRKQINDKTGKGWGNTIRVEHYDENGKVVSATRYAHLKDGSTTVKEGQRVQEGQDIATMGKTGGVSGPHLHYELEMKSPQTGKPERVDPGFTKDAKDTRDIENTEIKNPGEYNSPEDTPYYNKTH